MWEMCAILSNLKGSKVDLLKTLESILHSNTFIGSCLRLADAALTLEDDVAPNPRTGQWRERTCVGLEASPVRARPAYLRLSRKRRNEHWLQSLQRLRNFGLGF